MHIALNACRVIIFLKIKYYAADGLTSKDYREHCRALVNKVMTMDVQEKLNVSTSNKVPHKNYQDHACFNPGRPAEPISCYCWSVIIIIIKFLFNVKGKCMNASQQ